MKTIEKLILMNRMWAAVGALMIATFAAGCGSQGTESSSTATPPAETPAATSTVEDHSGHDHPIAITVTNDGFMPKDVKVKAGQPVTLAVTRTTDRTCATELVLEEYGINQKLPLNETVQIQFTPKESGQLTYACAMDMIKGNIIVE